MNKILVRLYVPSIEEQYDVWIPLNKRVYNVINLLVKAVNELSGGIYIPQKMPMIYDKVHGNSYDINLIMDDTNIRNGTEIILI